MVLLNCFNFLMYARMSFFINCAECPLKTRLDHQNMHGDYAATTHALQTLLS